MEINLTQENIFKFSSFIELLANCFNSFFGVDKATFCAAYPKISSASKEIITLNPPIFTYKYEKVPAVLGSTNKNQELKPRFRGSEEITNDDGEDITVEIWAQKFTYKFIVELWAEDGKTAERYIEKFQEFMNCYSDYFIECGLSNLIFLKISADQIENQWRSDLIRREISYRVDLDELVNVQRSDIQSILTKTKPSFNYSLNLVEGD